ncbi:UPF0057 membrane protein C04G6.5 [Toxocara canis]|uniref:UPF0057 membrane protein C04G6.5 n=2 Tax=Toxocara canis TaxID=6265 RepID=A0A0B2VGI1_TOXCA|nr:UPF0057 membrane protein C04G6.5 [Toxocara canis]VDM41954.1 unnamed protein product [Toxocara canis]
MALEPQHIIEFVLCFCLPPLAVFVHTTYCRIQVLICSLLCLLAWFPASAYALWFCFIRKASPDEANG